MLHHLVGVEVELENGETVSERADFAKGSPVHPMSERELGDKFHECASWGGVPKIKQERALELIWRLDESADIGEIIGALGK